MIQYIFHQEKRQGLWNLMVQKKISIMNIQYLYFASANAYILVLQGMLIFSLHHCNNHM